MFKIAQTLALLGTFKHTWREFEVSITIMTVMGVNDENHKVFSTILFSASSYTNRKIPSEDKDYLHFSGVNGDGYCTLFVLILCVAIG